MDWSYAIERHRKQLARIVATLFAMIGLANGAPVERLSRPVYFAVLRLLRPAESAVRRLIVVAARGIVVKPRTPSKKPVVLQKDRAAHPRRVLFKLFDPLQRFSTSYRFRRHPMPLERQRPGPRIRVIDVSFDPRIPFLRAAAATAPPPPEPAPEADDMMSAVRLSRRLLAIKAALEDLPREAKRLARWQARPAETRRPQRTTPLRSGAPPGHRKKPIHKVDGILTECNWLARHAARADTS